MLNPLTWGYCKTIATRLKQKGVEFDPFKIGVVDFFPKIQNSIVPLFLSQFFTTSFGSFEFLKSGCSGQMRLL